MDKAFQDYLIKELHEIKESISNLVNKDNYESDKTEINNQIRTNTTGIIAMYAFIATILVSVSTIFFLYK